MALRGESEVRVPSAAVAVAVVSVVAAFALLSGATAAATRAAATVATTTVATTTGAATMGAATTAAAPDTSARVDYDWRIRPLGAAPVKLGMYRGKVLFINAWASWCVPCVREMASIERLAARVGDIDVVFLMVAVERETAVRRHLRLRPLSLPVFVEDERFPAAFGLRGVPMTWIVDREGRIVYRRYGAAEWDIPEAEGVLRVVARRDSSKVTTSEQRDR